MAFVNFCQNHPDNVLGIVNQTCSLSTTQTFSATVLLLLHSFLWLPLSLLFS